MLTIDEIRSQYDSEWVLIADPEADAEGHVVRGAVVYHSKDRDEVGRKAIELRLEHSAFLYTGKIPADMVYVL